MKFKIESIKHQTEAVLQTLEAIRQGKTRIDIEMETGTGKTFTFISTIFEAYKNFKFDKFVIIVPRVAIKEGVFASFGMLKEFLNDKYPEINYDVYNYSGKTRDIHSFIMKDNLQILILTPNSFNKKDINILNSQRDELFGSESYIKQIATLKPCLIIDETHITGGKEGKTQDSILELNPRLILGYSATHINKENIVYSFSAKRAYEERQVKRLEYWNFEIENKIGINFTISGFNPEKKTAKLEQEGKSKTIKIGTEIGNFKVKHITASDVFFEGGKKYSELKQANVEEGFLIRTQIRETIKEHLKKKSSLNPQGIKVLSLFFVPSIDEFEIIKQIFMEEYGETAQEKCAWYFSVKKGFTAGEKEKEMTSLILKEKTKLLSLENPVEFIFAHTSLGTGWDNPNIFQICFLRNITSEVSRKQFIGRGLRLCVNDKGERIFEGSQIKDVDRINNLTIIASENYETFCKTYQKECNLAGEEIIENQIHKQKPKQIITARKEKLDLLKSLHLKLKQKTRWFISFGNLEIFYRNITLTLGEIEVKETSISLTKAEITKAEVLDYKQIDTLKQEYNENALIKEIAKETWLSLREVSNIFAKLNKENIKQNPNLWLSKAISKIKEEEENHLLSLAEIKYEKCEGEEFDLKDFYIEQRESGADLKPSEKSLYDYIDVDSNQETKTIDELEKEQSVEFYVKFQKTAGFHIYTPKGEYTPDFGIIIKNTNGKFYLVLEVKGSEINKLTPEEKFKIKCAISHFNAIGIESLPFASQPEFEGELKTHKIQRDLYSVYNPK